MQDNTPNPRIIILQALFIFAFFIITVKLFAVCLDHQPGQHNKKLQTALYIRPIIIDRNGVKLAVNLHTVSLYTNPRKVSNKEQLAKSLHEIFNDISYEKLHNKLSSQDSFIWIKRHLTPNEQYSVNNLGIPSLKFQHDQRRVYILGNLFSHILGYVDTDGNGLAGLERYIDGKKNDAIITLSVDSRVQNIVNEELTAATSRYQALGAAGIILNANNGEVLALASLPNFDPHKLNSLTDNQKFNRAILGLYEFGSTLKQFTIAAAIDVNLINTDTEYDISKPLKIGKHTIKDFHSHPTPTLTVEKIFTRSSNIGMAKIGMQLGAGLQKEYFYNMGLLSPLNIEISEKSNTITQKLWNSAVTASISYGYGISPTLLHIAQATASIVNGGIFYPATLFLHNNDQHTHVIKEETSEQMRALMRAVVRGGTGRRAQATGYDVGGKTGSGEKSINGVYMKNANVSSFIAAFPMESPKYVIAIMLDEPQPVTGSKFVTGGLVAAPIVKNIVNRIAPILNILPE